METLMEAKVNITQIMNWIINVYFRACPLPPIKTQKDTTATMFDKQYGPGIHVAGPKNVAFLNK